MTEIRCYGAELTVPAIVVHGGAGTFERARTQRDRRRLHAGLEAALAAAWLQLDAGGPALAAAVDAVGALEDSGAFNAGRGSVTTTAGTVETDAAVMNGADGVAGAVCAATWPANPVRAALAVAELSKEPDGPVLIGGRGADELAAAAGLAPMGEQPKSSGASEAGTVGAVAVDVNGHVAAATSTGGRRGQRPGRIGDSPIFGAGTWADDATAAVSATGAGEAFLLAGFAHLVDWHLRAGHDVERAVVTALGEVRRRGGSGGAIAIHASGEFAVAFDTPAMARGWRDRSTTSVIVVEPRGR